MGFLMDDPEVESLVQKLADLHEMTAEQAIRYAVGVALENDRRKKVGELELTWALRSGLIEQIKRAEQ